MLFTLHIANSNSEIALPLSQIRGESLKQALEQEFARLLPFYWSESERQTVREVVEELPIVDQPGLKNVWTITIPYEPYGLISRRAGTLAITVVKTAED